MISRTLIFLFCLFAFGPNANARPDSPSSDIAAYTRSFTQLLDIYRSAMDALDHLDALDTLIDGVEARKVNRSFAKSFGNEQLDYAGKKLARSRSHLASLPLPTFRQKKYADAIETLVATDLNLLDYLEKHKVSRTKALKGILAKRQRDSLGEAKYGLVGLRHLFNLTRNFFENAARAEAETHPQNGLFKLYVSANEATLTIVDAMIYWMDGGRKKAVYGKYATDMKIVLEHAKGLEKWSREAASAIGPSAAAAPEANNARPTLAALINAAIDNESKMVRNLDTARSKIHTLRKKPDFKFWTDLFDRLAEYDQRRLDYLRQIMLKRQSEL